MGVRRAGQYRAANDDDVIRRLVADDLADLFADAIKIGEVEASMATAGCADTDE